MFPEKRTSPHEAAYFEISKGNFADIWSVEILLAKNSFGTIELYTEKHSFFSQDVERPRVQGNFSGEKIDLLKEALEVAPHGIFMSVENAWRLVGKYPEILVLSLSLQGFFMSLGRECKTVERKVLALQTEGERRLFGRKEPDFAPRNLPVSRGNLPWPS